MKKNLITICLILVVTSQCFATDDIEVKFDTRWKNQYVAPDGFPVHGESVIQSWLTFSHKSGWYFIPWHSGEAGSHFLDKKNDYATEMDYTLGKLFQAGGLDVDLSLSYWDLEELFNSKGLDLFFTRLNLSKTFEVKQGETFTPYFQVSNYALINSSEGNGWCFSAGVYHGINLAENLDMSSELAVMYADGYLFADAGFIGKIDTSLSWKLGENTTLVLPCLTYYLPLQPFEDRGNKFVYGLGISYEF